MAQLALPSDKQPVVDPKTGRINQDWYNFFKQLQQVVNAGL